MSKFHTCTITCSNFPFSFLNKELRRHQFEGVSCSAPPTFDPPQTLENQFSFTKLLMVISSIMSCYRFFYLWSCSKGSFFFFFFFFVQAPLDDMSSIPNLDSSSWQHIEFTLLHWVFMQKPFSFFVYWVFYREKIQFKFLSKWFFVVNSDGIMLENLVLKFFLCKFIWKQIHIMTEWRMLTCDWNKNISLFICVLCLSLWSIMDFIAY